jgi:predicted nuclease of predicted toxin-antitoxin system
VRFLADEGFDGPLAAMLRQLGHDVRRVTHDEAASDEEVANVAKTEHRVLLTEDRDFGQLVFADAVHTGGVVYIRFFVAERDQIADELVKLLDEYGDGLHSRFVVMQPGRIRVSRLPK